MKKQELISVFAICLGLYFAAVAFSEIKLLLLWLPGLWLEHQDTTRSFFWTPSYYAMINFGVDILIAWFLIRKSHKIGHYFSGMSITDLEVAVKKAEVLEIVIVGISFWLVIRAIPELINAVISYGYAHKEDREIQFWNPDSFPNLIYCLLRIGIGSIVLTNYRPIARIIIRYGDQVTKHYSDPPSND